MQWRVKSYDELSVVEFHKILKSRIDVFVVEQQCPYPELDNTDDRALHIWLEDNAEIVAYCRIFPSGVKYPEASIGRVLTTKKYRNKGWSRKLLLKALDEIKMKFNTEEVRISAQDYLIGFYQSLGFQDTQKKYLEDGIPHTEMIK